MWDHIDPKERRMMADIFAREDARKEAKAREKAKREHVALWDFSDSDVFADKTGNGHDLKVIRCEGHAHECPEQGTHVKLEPSRTLYHWDGEGEDPNRARALCRDCAEAHHAHWDSMWQEYNSGRL